MSGVFLHLSPLRKVSVSESRANRFDLARLAGQLAPGIFQSLRPALGVQAHCTASPGTIHIGLLDRVFHWLRSCQVSQAG